MVQLRGLTRLSWTLGTTRTSNIHINGWSASLLIHHGQSVKVVPANLGHANATETLGTYSHLWPDSEDESRAAVDRARGARGQLLVTTGVTGGGTRR